MLKVVCNSTPLIHLAKIGKLHLLEEIFHEILIPPSVYRECVIEGNGRDDAQNIQNALWIRTIQIKDIDLKKAINVTLDDGESEAITLALQEKADLILLDDYDAREFARVYELNITGTIGVLIKAKHMSSIQSLEVVLKNLRDTGFWLNDDLYYKVLQETGEL